MRGRADDVGARGHAIRLPGGQPHLPLPEFRKVIGGRPAGELPIQEGDELIAVTITDE